jgi:uncharacterized RDD family membrane protein YckC
VSGIPVGSPAVPPGRHAAPSGWYADPLDAGQERYWDGWQWSRNTREREGSAPVTPPAAPAPGQPPRVADGPQPGYVPPGYPPQGYPQQPGSPQQPGYPQPGYPGYPGQQGRPGQPALTADGVPLAGWWWRVLATVVDNVVVGLLATLASLPVLIPLLRRVSAYFAEVVAAAEQGLPQPPIDQAVLVPATDQLVLTAVSVTLTFVYQLVFLRWRSATPGKLLCGLRVVPVDQGRAPVGLDWRRAFSRALVWAAPGLSPLLGVFQLLDVLFPLWQRKRQALHDLLARTQVVRR